MVDLVVLKIDEEKRRVSLSSRKHPLGNGWRMRNPVLLKLVLKLGKY